MILSIGNSVSKDFAASSLIIPTTLARFFIRGITEPTMLVIDDMVFAAEPMFTPSISLLTGRTIPSLTKAAICWNHTVN